MGLFKKWRDQRMQESSDAFFKSMMNNPDDPTTRLVWADWLEEHENDPELAALLRAHAALNQDPASVPDFKRMILPVWNKAIKDLHEQLTDKGVLTPIMENFPTVVFIYARTRNRFTFRHDRTVWQRSGNTPFGATEMAVTPGNLKKFFRDIYPAVRKVVVIGMLYADGMPIAYAHTHAPGDETMLANRHRMYSLITQIERMNRDLEEGLKDYDNHVNYNDLVEKLAAWFTELHRSPTPLRFEELRVAMPFFDKLTGLLRQYATYTNDHLFANLANEVDARTRRTTD